MFNFFKGRKEVTTITDVVWMTEESKWTACTRAIQNEPVICAVWFEETYQKLLARFSTNHLSSECIYHTRQLTPATASEKKIIFCEHYPLAAREEELLQKLGLTSATFYSSLDEPLLKHFGSEKISNLLRKMGVKEDEPIEHAMVSAAIHNAQEKIASKISFEQSAHSQAEWLMKNMIA